MEKTRQILALTKRQFIAAWRLSGDGLALSVSLRSPAPPKGELIGSAGSVSATEKAPPSGELAALQGLTERVPPERILNLMHLT